MEEDSVVYLTSASLAEGQKEVTRASLWLCRPSGEKFAVATASVEQPVVRLQAHFDISLGPCTLEATGGVLEVLGYREPTLEIDKPLAGRRKSPVKKAASLQTKGESVTEGAPKQGSPAEVKEAPKEAPTKGAPQPGVPKKEVAAKEADKKEAPKPETPKKEVAPKEAAKKEAPKPETPKKEAATSEAAKKEAPKPENPDFIPAKTWDGTKPGLVFRTGAKGLGYYRDQAPKTGVKRPGGAPADEPPAKKGVLAGGLKYEVVRAASGRGPQATRGASVHVQYDGRLASSGRRFDKGKIKFRLGAGEVIKGWDLGVAGMGVGEKRKLLIPPKLAYGPRGAPPDIPPNATLAFDVELLKVG